MVLKLCIVIPDFQGGCDTQNNICPHFSTASTVGTTFMNRTSESFQALDGSLDEVRVMSSVLSAANILVLYNKGGETK